MKFILKTLIVAACLLIFQALYMSAHLLVDTPAEKIASEGGAMAAIGTALFALVMYAGVFYILFAMVYTWLRRGSLSHNLILATALSVVAYLLVRVPDMIDGDFISKMSLYVISFIIPTVLAFLVGGRLSDRVRSSQPFG